jgi:hypothetical protein
MQGVKGKEDAYEPAPPEVSCHSEYDGEDKKTVQQMDQEIRKVMSPRIQSEELEVQHVGKPSQRVPIIHIIEREGPNNGRKRKSLSNMRIFCHIDIVI